MDKNFIANLKEYCNYDSCKMKNNTIVLENVRVKKPIRFGEHLVLKSGSIVESVIIDKNNRITLKKNNKSKSFKPSILNEAFYFPGITDLYGNVIQQDEMGTDIIGMTNITTVESIMNESKAVLIDIINKISNLSIEELSKIEANLKHSFAVEDEILYNLIQDIKNKSNLI